MNRLFSRLWLVRFCLTGFCLSALLCQEANAADEYRSVEQVLSAFSSEPTVGDVQEMTLQYSKTDNRYVDAWMKAAKNANWLPEVRVAFGYSTGDDYDYTYWPDDTDIETLSSTPYLTDAAGGVDNDFDVYAKWRLDKLIMSSERIRVISETQDIVKLRDKVLEEVTRLYFERRRLQVDMLLNPGDLKAQLKNELRLQELTAQIDAYTGGRFSETLQRK